MKIGNEINFGNYEWQVLDVKDATMLIITKDIVEQRDYHNKKESVTWETSESRHYLNKEFFERFNDSEKERIIPVLNKNPGNPWYGSDGGNDTTDKVFLLSMDECVRKYFGDSSRLLDNPKPNQRYWFDRKDENNSKRKAQFMNGIWWWWTRTPGKHNRVEVYIHGDGNIGIQGNGICKTTFNTLHYITQSNQGGLRPAVWVKK